MSFYEGREFSTLFNKLDELKLADHFVKITAFSILSLLEAYERDKIIMVHDVKSVIDGINFTTVYIANKVSEPGITVFVGDQVVKKTGAHMIIFETFSLSKVFSVTPTIPFSKFISTWENFLKMVEIN